MQVNLPSEISGTSMSPKSISYPHNCYNIQGALVPRSGITKVLNLDVGVDGDSTTHRSRGMVVSADGERLYMIQGDQLLRISSSNTVATLLATVSNPDTVLYNGSVQIPFSFAVGFTGIAIATGEKNYFIDTSTDVVTEITDVDLPACRSVVYIDGRFIWCPVDGETIIYGEVNDPFTVSALSFFDAETRPDKNLELGVIGNDLYVFGSRSIERFRNTGNPNQPFQRITNSIISIGYTGGMIRLSDKLIFIGRRLGGGNRIYSLSGSRVDEISNSTINEFMERASFTFGRTADIEYTNGMSFSDYGLEIYAFNFAGLTQRGSERCIYISQTASGYISGFISDIPTDNQYDAGARLWPIQDYINAERPFSLRNSVFYKGNYYFQGGATYEQSGLYTHTSFVVDTSGENLSYGFRVGIRSPNGKDLSLNSVKVEYGKQGGLYNTASFGDPVGGTSADKMLMYVSKSGVGWGHSLSSTLTTTAGREWHGPIERSYGDLSNEGRLEFNVAGGLGSFDGYIGLAFEVYGVPPIAIEGIRVNA